MSKLNEAQKKLEQCFADLEDAVLMKIDQIKEEQLNPDDLDENSQNIIKSLNEEINSLQKALSDLGVENESLMQELKQMKVEQGKLVHQIKTDLNSIKQIINAN